MFSLIGAGINSFDVETRRGAFAGTIVWNQKRDDYSVYFNSNCTRGSKRRFTSVDDAVKFIYDRRVKKCWGV